MCTVTFLPHQKGFILTSNRDEWSSRKPAELPKKYHIHGKSVYFPKDQQAGGTWIAVGQQHTLCLLNGAFERHTSQPPYRLSRGLMLLDFFRYDDIDNFSESYDFTGIENFTLVMVKHDRLQLQEIRWDGKELHVNRKDVEKKHIWSSCTLYEPEIIEQRTKWFQDWQEKNPVYDVSKIMHFHKFGGSGDVANDIMMNRENKVRTVSITSVKKTSSESRIYYMDVETNELSDLLIDSDSILI